MINQYLIFGRETETAELSSIISKAGKSSSSFVLIGGEAGIGKTTLVEEFLKNNSIYFYTSRGIENTMPAYGVLSSVLRSYLREEKKSQIDFGPLTKYLGYLLPEIKSNEEKVEKITIAEALCDALTIISDKKLLVIFLDDLQWADDAALELLPLLADKLKNSSIVFLGVYRNDNIRRDHKLRWMRNELKRKRILVEINLTSFDENQTGELVKQLIGKIPSKELLQLIYDKTNGTAFFIEEFCDTLINKNLIVYKDGEAELKPESHIPLPESIIDAVLYKVDALSEDAKELLEIAAIAGEEFDLKIFKAIAGHENCIDELFLHNLLKEGETGKGVFKHALTREAVLSEITWSRKQELNRKAADFFQLNNYPPGQIAYHYLEANELEKARNLFLQSAQRSCDIQAYSDAVRSTYKALEIWHPGSDEDLRLDTLLQLAHCAHLSGQLNDAIKVLIEVVDIGERRKNYNNLGFAYRSLATIYGLQGKWELVIKARIKSAESFAAADKFDEAAIEFLAASARCSALLKFDDALIYSSKAFDLSSKINRIDIKARALGLKGNILAMLGKFSEGRIAAQEGLELALKNNFSEAASEIYRRLASTLEYQSDYVSAIDIYSKAYNFCIASGEEVYAQICLGCMSYNFFQTGEWKKSLEVCMNVINNKRSPDGSKCGALGMSGLIHAFRGEIKSAVKCFNNSYSITKKTQNNAVYFMIYWGRAVISEIENNISGAAENYKNVIEMWNFSQDKHDVILVLIWAANFFARNKMEKELISCTEILSSIPDETSNPEALSGLAFALGELLFFNNKLNEAAEQFEQSLSHQSKLNVPLEKMFIEARLGELLIRLNKNEEAIEKLSSAYNISKNLSVRPFASKISSLLKMLNFKIDERTNNSFMIDRLTKRQNEILKLLVKGLTNKEIAGQIFLSTRTVDMHVGHILERLNCRTRTEAISRAKELEII